MKNDEQITIQGDVSCRHVFLHNEDTSNAFIKILEKGKFREIYNIGCDENIAKILITKIKGVNVVINDWI